MIVVTTDWWVTEPAGTLGVFRYVEYLQSKLSSLTLPIS